MKRIYFQIVAVIGALAWPSFGQAQTVADDVQSMHTVLSNVYDQMIPLCSQLISVAQGIAGFGATFYIGYRVWRHIANAEPVDFFPLFRPFVIGFAVLIFPSVIVMINGIMQRVVTETH